MEEKDPAEDRDEFLLRIDSIYMGFNDQDIEKILISILLEDTETISFYKRILSENLVKKQTALDNYDAALSIEEKRIIVGNIKP